MDTDKPLEEMTIEELRFRRAKLKEMKFGLSYGSNVGESPLLDRLQRELAEVDIEIARREGLGNESIS